MKPIKVLAQKSSPCLADLILMVAIFTIGIVVGTLNFSAFIKSGEKPEFHQPQFSPAVMLACGFGYTRPSSPINSLTDFLQVKVDTFTCDKIPSDLPVIEPIRFALVHRYLISLVGISWIILGKISWSGLAPMFGVLFSLVVTLTYCIFRLGMRRFLAMLAALALTISPFHLIHLPHLRNYAKAPFILALVFIMGWLVTQPLNRKVVLGLSIVGGVILGLGFGFRTDLIIVIIPFLATIFLFLPGSVLHNIKLKIGASALFLTFFFIISWSIISIRASDNSIFHVALIGLTSDRTSRLGITTPLYDFGGDGPQKDVFMNVMEISYAYQVSEHLKPKLMASRYFMEILKNFPADLLIRGYAAILKILDLPFMNPVNFSSLPATGVSLPNQPLPIGIHNSVIINFYYQWNAIFPRLAGLGPILVGLSLLMIGAYSLRKALFLTVMLFYFVGITAIQFETRHFFHLEFISWWFLGFAIQHVLAFFNQMRHRESRQAMLSIVSHPRRWWNPTVRRLICFGLGIMLAVFVPLYVLRQYQHWNLGNILQAYSTAETVPLTITVAPLKNNRLLLSSPDLGASVQETSPISTEYLIADFDPELCDYSTLALTIRYRKPVQFLMSAPMRRSLPLWDLSYKLRIDLPHLSQESTRVIFPIYYMPLKGIDFEGIEMARAQAACLRGLYRIKEISRLPIQFSLILKLPPKWKQAPRFLTLKALEPRDEAQVHLFTFPEDLPVARDLLESTLPMMSTSTLTVHSDQVKIEPDKWIVRGPGEKRFSPLIHVDNLELKKGSYFVAQGELRSGGFLLGLVKEEQWDGKKIVVEKDKLSTLDFFRKHQSRLDWVSENDWNAVTEIVINKTTLTPELTAYTQWGVVKVTEKGKFKVIIQVPVDGKYSIVLANSLMLPTSNTDFVIDSANWVETQPIDENIFSPKLLSFLYRKNLTNSLEELPGTTQGATKGVLPLTLSDIELSSNCVQWDSQQLHVSGIAMEQLSPLIELKTKRLKGGSKFLVRGTLHQGGFTVVLTNAEENWVDQAIIAEPGAFEIVLEIPEDDSYSLVLTSYLTESSTGQDFTINQAGWLESGEKMQ